MTPLAPSDAVVVGRTDADLEGAMGAVPRLVRLKHAP